MKRTFKLIGSGAAALLVLGFATPVLAERAAVTSPVENGSTQFCTNLPSKITDVNNGISKLQSNLTTARTNRAQKLTTDWTNTDSKLASARSGWAAWRQQQFTALEAKATTDAQKAAVQTYETTLKTAISTRESANDAARTTRRNGVLAAINAQNSTVDSQISVFISAVKEAEATAQSSCASSPTNPSIRATFISAMKTARQTFVSERKADGNISSQVKALNDARDATIHANELTFKSVENAAQKILLAALSSSSSQSTAQ